jgi:8-oxo-dGTP diphosphatase
MSEKIVEVAAAILLRDDDREFLLACRPADKVYAGYWEFPGGKVEAGETPHEALVRELDEEMQIRITDAAPWLCRRFVYPHAHVRIHFFRVWQWQGAAQAVEHSAAAWQRSRDAATVTPILPANGPILKALSLPRKLLITCAEENGIDGELARIERSLDTDCLLQIRDKTLATEERTTFATAAITLARQRGVPVVVNDDCELARQLGADGVQLSAAALAASHERPDFLWVGASCHSREEITRAAQLGCDYATLSCVQPSLSHPDTPSLGWPGFSTHREDREIPVFALGGLTPSDLATAQRQGAHGIALMRRW